MKKYPGFLNCLQNQFQSLDSNIVQRISKTGGLDIHTLISLLLNPIDNSVDCAEEVDHNHVIKHSSLDEYSSFGKDLINENSIALCILSGGAGTRADGPKCFLKLNEKDSLLTYKIKKNLNIKNIWVIVTEEIREKVENHLKEANLLREGIALITQYESLRLTPDNQLLMVDQNPSLYPCGHGDVIPALQHSQEYHKFISSGGKHVVIVNVDNISADVDHSILGLHHFKNSPVTCEVVRKHKEDKGGVLCSYNGIEQIVEEFRMTPETNLNNFHFMNTNTIIFRSDLDFNTIVWNWYRVKKILNGQLVVQYERLLQQITSHFKTQYVEVERAQRFIPIKSLSDLDELNSHDSA